MPKCKQRFGCVYRLTNLITKRAYIGKTVNFKRRMGEHKYDSKKMATTYLSRSIQKHGWHNFKKEIIIDDIPEEDLSNLEISYIEVENTLAPNGMNLTLGGEGMSGYKRSKESCEKTKQGLIVYYANRDQFGTVSFVKSKNKYVVYGPAPDCKYIGQYLTKKKAKEALNQFNESGKILESDRKKRRRGTGSIGFVSFNKSRNKYEVRGPKRKYIGHYLTKEKAIEALNQFNKSGERIESDRTNRRRGTGTITKRGKRYQVKYKKNKKYFWKTFDTPEECENWLKNELNF